MTFTPRDYQITGAHLIAAAIRAGQPELFVSPTGSGKGVIIALALAAHPGLVAVVPGPDIARSVKAKCDTPEAADRVVTARAYLNTIRAGTAPLPAGLLYDEGHHSDDTHRELSALCACPHVGLTATPFCGSAGATQEMRAFYGNRVCTLLTLRDSVARGYTVAPSFTTVPLLDDEMIDVRGGEFVVRTTTTAVAAPDRVAAVCELLMAPHARTAPGTLVLPSVEATRVFAEALNARGLPHRVVTGDTSGSAREDAFAAVCAPPYPILLQVAVVTEGVDIPLRRMWDISPTTSPRLWQQRVGRLTRPGGESHYYSLCHNFLRHGYLWEGIAPASAWVQAVTAWPTPPTSTRMFKRALDLPTLGRFTPVALPTRSGTPAHLYALRGGPAGLTRIAALLVAQEATPRYYLAQDTHTGATKTFSPRPGVEVAYQERAPGKWRRVAELPDCSGFASLPLDTPSPRGLQWWVEAAARFGLDPNVRPNGKQFASLPILRDTREKLP